MKNFYLKNKKYIIFFLILFLYFRLTIPVINWYLGEISKCFKLELNLIETTNLLNCVYALFKTPQILLIFVFISFLITIATYIWYCWLEYYWRSKRIPKCWKRRWNNIWKTPEGESVCLPEDTFLNKNIAVFGASGSRKTRAFVILNILVQASLGKSIVCTDPKGELYKKCAKYLVKKGINI